jgi:hypothetical protein
MEQTRGLHGPTGFMETIPTGSIVTWREFHHVHRGGKEPQEEEEADCGDSVLCTAALVLHSYTTYLAYLYTSFV